MRCFSFSSQSSSCSCSTTASASDSVAASANRPLDNWAEVVGEWNGFASKQPLLGFNGWHAMLMLIHLHVMYFTHNVAFNFRNSSSSDPSCRAPLLHLLIIVIVMGSSAAPLHCRKTPISSITIPTADAEEDSSSSEHVAQSEWLLFVGGS